MIYAIANLKGGTGKTTTACALAAGLKRRGRNVISLDLDPQWNMTFSFGADPDARGVYEVMTGKAAAADVIQTTELGDIISSNPALYAVSSDKEIDVNTLKDSIKPIRRKYDDIVLDCPPTMNQILINALMAADQVIVPLSADVFGLQGIMRLHETVEEVKTIKNGNRRLRIAGVVFVRYNGRTVLAKQMTQIIVDKCADLKIHVFETKIREGIAVREAQATRRSVFDVAPRSNPATDYAALIDEILTINPTK